MYFRVNVLEIDAFSTRSVELPRGRKSLSVCHLRYASFGESYYVRALCRDA